MRSASLVISPILLTLTLVAGIAYAVTGGALPAYIAAALADSARPPEDTARDAVRKPGETMVFAGIKPGMTLLEIGPGKGYYTRLLSGTLGPKGKLFALTSQQPSGKPTTAQTIAADPHYTNVTAVVRKITDPLDLPEKVDLVWTSQNYHDFHDIAELDVVALNKRVFDALKPGGIYFVLDHSAQNSSGLRDTETLHRIDEGTVKQEVEAAGFKFLGESNLLRNKSDPRTAKVFDPSIQGHTDQFLLKFKKP